jgi:hypothetical protein
MKKHVEGDHFAFMKRLAKDPNYITIAKVFTNLNASKKRAHVSPSEIFGYCLLQVSSKKMTQHRWVSWMISCYW